MANDSPRSDGNETRDRYRDNDDVRRPLEGNDRAGNRPDTKSEARGNARDAVGNTADDTDADPTGPDENDQTKHRPRPDSFDADLNSVGG